MDETGTRPSPQTLAALRRIAQRDRERYQRAAARVEALEAELTALRGSASYRLTQPLRRLAMAVPLYGALRGGRSRAVEPSTVSVEEGDAPVGPVALLIDNLFPEPDRDSGSIDIVTMAAGLQRLGFVVLFGARREHDAGPEKRVALEASGVRTLGVQDDPDLESYVKRIGPSLALVVLNRVYCGGDLFELVLTSARQARIVFNAVDLNWIRVGREASLTGDRVLGAAAEQSRIRELHLARETDAIIVVSAVEAEILRRDMPDAYVVELPLARPVRPPRAGFAERRGVGFIGGFKHAPNVDAIRWFAREIWPRVLHVRPDCRFTVVGPDLPAGILDNVPGEIEALGHVPDVGPWFESLCLTVAPLRFGAGAKGKVVSSLAAGVPCVATSLALEGMGLGEAEGAVEADTPETLAAAIADLLDDPVRWERLSWAGVEAATRHFSPDSWQERLADMLTTLHVLPTVSG